MLSGCISCWGCWPRPASPPSRCSTWSSGRRRSPRAGRRCWKSTRMPSSPCPGNTRGSPWPSTGTATAGSTTMTRPSRWTGRRSRSCWGSLRPSARPLSSPTWRTTPSTAWTTPPAPSSWPRRRRAIPSSWATTATWTSSGMSPPGTATCTWRSATPWTCMIPISAA